MSSMNEPRTDAQGLPVLFSGGLGPSGETGSYKYAQGHPKFGQEFDPADNPKNRPPPPSMMQPRGGGGIGNIRQQMFNGQQMFNRQQPIRTPPWLMQQRNQRFQRPYGGGPGFAKPLSPPPSAPNQAGGTGGPPTSWKMSIEPMAHGGMIPGYHSGGSIIEHTHGLDTHLPEGYPGKEAGWQRSINTYATGFGGSVADTVDFHAETGQESSSSNPARERREKAAEDANLTNLLRKMGISDAQYARMRMKYLLNPDSMSEREDLARRYRSAWPHSVPQESDISDRVGAEEIIGEMVADPKIPYASLSSAKGRRMLGDRYGEAVVDSVLAEQKPSYLRGSPTVRSLDPEADWGDAGYQQIMRILGSSPSPETLEKFYDRQSRASGGIIGLRGGGEVPMILVDGEYIPAYLFGGLWKGVKKVAKVAAKTAPIWSSFLPGGPLVAAGISGVLGGAEKKLSGGSWGDALNRGIMTGAAGYAASKAVGAGKKGWGDTKGDWKDKLAGAMGGAKGSLSMEDLLKLGPLVAAAEGGGGGGYAPSGRVMPGAGGRGTQAGGATIYDVGRGASKELNLFGRLNAGRASGGMIPGQESPGYNRGSLYANRRFGGGPIPEYRRGRKVKKKKQKGGRKKARQRAAPVARRSQIAAMQPAVMPPPLVAPPVAPAVMRPPPPPTAPVAPQIQQQIPQTYANLSPEDEELGGEFEGTGGPGQSWPPTPAPLAPQIQQQIPETYAGWDGGGEGDSEAEAEAAVPIDWSNRGANSNKREINWDSGDRFAGRGPLPEMPWVTDSNPALTGDAEETDFSGMAGQFGAAELEEREKEKLAADREKQRSGREQVAAAKAAKDAAARYEVGTPVGTPPPPRPPPQQQQPQQLFETSGYNPFSMPTTAGQFAQAGNAGAASMLNRMNTVVEPKKYFQEGGIIEELSQDETTSQVLQMVAQALQAPDDPQAAEIISGFEEAFGEEALMELIELISGGAEMPAGADEGLQMPGQVPAAPAMLPAVPPAASPMQLGGLIPGNGDAMADDIITVADEGTPAAQKIAISSGEYVVAGDVVSGLGSGNTDAGAEVLDQLQEDVRMSRTGTNGQPPPMDLSEVLPATYGGRYA